MDYGASIAPIMAVPQTGNQVCFNIQIDNDVLVEESQECLMASFTAESLANLEIGTSSSICCIVDDDSKSVIIITNLVHHNNIFISPCLT